MCRGQRPPAAAAAELAVVPEPPLRAGLVRPERAGARVRKLPRPPPHRCDTDICSRSQASCAPACPPPAASRRVCGRPAPTPPQLPQRPSCGPAARTARCWLAVAVSRVWCCTDDRLWRGRLPLCGSPAPFWPLQLPPHAPSPTPAPPGRRRQAHHGQPPPPEQEGSGRRMTHHNHTHTLRPWPRRAQHRPGTSTAWPVAAWMVGGAVQGMCGPVQHTATVGAAANPQHRPPLPGRMCSPNNPPCPAGHHLLVAASHLSGRIWDGQLLVLDSVQHRPAAKRALASCRTPDSVASAQVRVGCTSLTAPRAPWPHGLVWLRGEVLTWERAVKATTGDGRAH